MYFKSLTATLNGPARPEQGTGHAVKGRDSMNKSELIEALAEKINLPIREAASITNTIIETMSDALASGDSIEIRGFGSFVVKEYGSYTGRNPKTGEKIKVAPKKLPFFKVGKDLRERVDQKG